MSTVLTLNGGVLVSGGSAVTHDGGSSTNIQESKSYTVSGSGSATISPDTGYDAMEEVALTVPAGSEGTPTATKGTVSNHAISITPSVTNTGGYIAGSTKTGTAVSVSASELVSGTYNVNSSGTKDVTNYASASIPAGSATGPSSLSGSSATISTGTNTLTLTKTGVTTTPTISSGYVSSATASTASVSLTASVTTNEGGNYYPELDDGSTYINIPSGSYFTNPYHIYMVRATNIAPENIKQGVVVELGDYADSDRMLSVTGTYAGTASATLKMGVVRPDAELVQTWSGDYLAHNDKNITIPSYSTTATTLYTGTASSTKPTLSNANYRYYVLERFLTIPQYSITTKAAGRQEYTAMSICYEIVQFPGSTFKALVDGTAYTSRNTAAIAAGNAFIRCLYWSSGSALSVYTANTNGCAQTMTAPSISSATSASPTLTITEPSLTIKGSATYLSQTYYNAITDIRAQYVIQLYRVPLNTDSTYGISGWGHYTQMLHNISCAQSTTHKLT